MWWLPLELLYSRCCIIFPGTKTSQSVDSFSCWWTWGLFPAFSSCAPCFWERSWSWCHLPRKATQEGKQIWEGMESEVVHTQAWVEVSAGQELIWYLELQQTTSRGLAWARVHHFSSLTAKVDDRGLVSTFKEAEAGFMKGAAPLLSASVPLDLSIPKCGAWASDGT